MLGREKSRNRPLKPKRENNTDAMAANGENLVAGNGTPLTLVDDTPMSGVDATIGGNYIPRCCETHDESERNEPSPRFVNHGKEVFGRGHMTADRGVHRAGAANSRGMAPTELSENFPTRTDCAPEKSKREIDTTTADPYVEVIVEKCVTGPHSDGRVLVAPGIYIYAFMVDE